ncbi:hypothetical protein KTO58_07255 [Chitinophaga pendula]|uniref:hypothetical protein n=1 Tax=Chitinophaga TaxID=79328 RepID=UPI0012FE69DC|nr:MULTISPECIES: hypothetical protein [Chitinophaga]UCJ08972.1 hypothetical protein KTO58_07255 [Chitinophaga pendula]
MEKRAITVYMGGRPYRLFITLDNERNQVLYEVVTHDNPEQFMADFIGQEPVLIEEISTLPEEGQRIVEAEQVARVIWQEILDEMSR